MINLLDIKVLFIAHDSSLYGANQSLVNMISSLENKTIDITVLVPNNGPICQVLEGLGVQFHIINYRSEIFGSNKSLIQKTLNILRFFYKIIVNYFALNRLNRLNKSNKFDIIHSNSSVISIGEKFARMNNIRHIWHLREYIDLDHKANVYGGMNRYKNKIQNSDQIICITRGIAHHFGVENNAFVLRDAVRKNSERVYKEKTDNYFLFCGSLQEGKGIEIALKAFNLLDNKSIRLLIAGTGNLQYETYLKEIVNTYNNKSNIEFLGFRDDIDLLMYNAKAFLMCSENEALGRVTPEAMLNFCPVIGFNNAGTADIITDHKTGLLFNDTEHLVSIMTSILQNGINLNPIRIDAYNYAKEHFLEDSFGIKLFDFYKSLN